MDVLESVEVVVVVFVEVEPSAGAVLEGVVVLLELSAIVELDVVDGVELVVLVDSVVVLVFEALGLVVVEFDEDPPALSVMIFSPF